MMLTNRPAMNNTVPASAKSVARLSPLHDIPSAKALSESAFFVSACYGRPLQGASARRFSVCGRTNLFRSVTNFGLVPDGGSSHKDTEDDTMSHPTLIAPVIRLIDGKAITTSRAVAEYFRKQHNNVIQVIKSLECSDQFLTANFSAVNFKHNGNTYTEYQITRDGFTFLAMGFTGKKAAAFKEAYITAFNEMESQLANPTRIHLPRLLVSFDVNGKQQVTTIEPECFVSTFDTLPNHIAESPKVQPSTLLKIINVCARKLSANKELKESIA